MESNRDSSDKNVIHTNQEMNAFDNIRRLQRQTENIRNICVIAHVDHGKTSLVDSLISYNNIINPRLAGDIRYMDWREDEQERCITMKSSSISLTYRSEVNDEDYLINLSDSPGHVDFSSEIFSALKICDGAIIIIDVVEGICSQTESVIKQAWDEKIKCILVLNKIDRLISEVQMEPLEAYLHLNNLLEKANSLMGSLIVRDINIKTEQKEKNENSAGGEYTSGGEPNTLGENDSGGEIDIDKLIQEKENELYFSPDKGNVIFTSAIDNWGFTLNSFSEILAKKIGFKREAIKKMLWGDFYFNSKNKKIYITPEGANNSKPMFVEFILENIYKLYKMLLIEKNTEKIKKAANSINVVLTQKDIASIEKNPRFVLKTIFRQWLPLPPTVFEVATKHLPNPITACANKLDILFPYYKFSNHDYPVIKKLRDYINNKKNWNINDQDNQLPSIAFVSKMVPIPRKNIAGEVFNYLNENDKDQKEDIRFMAFARNYFGNFKRGQEYYVIGPKHDPKTNNYDIKKYKFDQLYFFMGQYLEEINEVPAGNIFSVGGLDNYIYKTATISSVFECPSIIPGNINKNSIIKVSITTQDIKDMSKLVEGLKKLHKSDPAVEYYVQSNGEHILETAGEVHLERCIKDLEDHLARVKIKTSPPIVNFKEGLNNKNYQLRRKNAKDSKIKQEKIVDTKEKERKKDLNKYYMLNEGDDNVDIDNAEEILASCVPMVLTKEPKQAKPEEKGHKHKVEDIKSIKGKTNFYIEKNVRSTNDKTNFNGEKNKAYAEDITPNQICKISVSAVGMNDELISFLEKNEFFLKELENRNYIIGTELFEKFILFKTELLNLIENKRLKQIVETNLFSFGPNNTGQNMLLIKNISRKFSFFDKVKIAREDETNQEPDSIDKEENDDGKTEEININNTISEKDLNEVTNSKNKIDISENKSTSNKASYKSSKSKEVRTKVINTKNVLTTSTEYAPSLIEDEISHHLKDQVTINEFLNSIKSGFELAASSGPLCEEQMYGVIFIIEDINIMNPTSTEVKKNNCIELNENDNNISNDNCVNPSNKLNLVEVNTNFKIGNNNEKEPESVNGLIENIRSEKSTKNSKSEVQDDQKSNSESINSKQFQIYGPFLGQIIGTVKDCCRTAFLNGEPRLYEAIYLCLFQIKQEHVGKIHSVVSKRRGTIINEYSNESIICTIEAVVPVAESFGFVEEIRINTSGMANPMLQFHKWEMINIDPFDIPVSQEMIDNFGMKADIPNLAKTFINKIRLRKGLPIDEKIIKGADKQKTLSRKR